MTLPRQSVRCAGFTLIELLVVVVIIGILAALAVPQYTKTLEVSKANDAVATLKMVGTTNRMYRLDHNNQYVGAGTITTTACNTSTNCPDTANPACSLLSCKYLAAQDWANMPYSFTTGAGTCGGTAIACAKRQGTNNKTYQDWAYGIDESGVVTAIGGAPAPN